MSGKRKNEEMDVDSGSEEEKEDEEMESEQEQVEFDVLSPSPETKKKDMHLRSGRRKRRRSKETTGLTPPDQIVKKMRTTEKKKAARMEEKKGDDDLAQQQTQQQQQELPVSSVDSPQANGDVQDKVAAHSSQQQPTAGNGAAAAAMESPASSPETGRKLFDATPPPQTGATMSASVNVVNSTTATMGVASPILSAPTSKDTVAQESSPQVVEQHPVSPSRTNGSYPEPSLESVQDTTQSKCEGLWSIFFFFLFAVVFILLCPYDLHLVDILVNRASKDSLPAINATEIRLEFEQKLLSELPTEEEVYPEVVEEELVEGEPKLEFSAKITEGVHHIRRVKHALEQSRLGVDSAFQDIVQMLMTAHDDADEKTVYRQERIEEFNTMDRKVRLALDNATDLSDSLWKDAIEASKLHITDTTVIDLWEIDDPIECSSPETVPTTEEVVIDPKIVSPARMEAELESISERAIESANKIRYDEEMEERAREWVRLRIESIVNGNEIAADALSKIKAINGSSDEDKEIDGVPVEDFGIEDIDGLINDRLEIERADRTGQYDHASLLNGAQIIYGGKRGTSNSLIDTLPLYNRIMQAYKLRFYGFGPEAAIVPTWPQDALGQCWSFEPIPLKELLKKKRGSMGDDDHKRGSFGTLTISLPQPVNVKSVVIEHPPKGVTDNTKTAIRAFRVVGYSDAMATEKSWSLGSFEYDIGNKNSMQEFLVATEIFRTPVPPLQSITLAIDSNWGSDYACLYRFRVHGELEV